MQRVYAADAFKSGDDGRCPGAACNAQSTVDGCTRRRMGRRSHVRSVAVQCATVGTEQLLLMRGQGSAVPQRALPPLRPLPLLARGSWAPGHCGAGQRWRAGRRAAPPLTHAQPVRAARRGSPHSAPDARRPCGRRRVRSRRHAPAPPLACGRRSRRAGVCAQPWAHEPRPKRARLATTQRASDASWRNARSGLRAPAWRAHSVAAFERTWPGNW
jgi:hypothetical protein